MLSNITTIERLIDWCESKVVTYEKSYQAFDEKRSEDIAEGNVSPSFHWLSWHATTLLGEACEAFEAQGILVNLPKAREYHGDENVLGAFRTEALRNVAGYNKPRVDSRSTLVASNLAEDHKHAFWVELLNALTSHEEFYPERKDTSVDFSDHTVGQTE